MSEKNIVANRASPASLRKSLEAVDGLVKAGVMFVPIPVLNDDDLAELTKMSVDRLELLAQAAEKSMEEYRRAANT